jgi:periplasmic protein TonB
MMNSIRIAVCILLAGLIAGPGWAQEKSAPPTPPMRIRIGGNVAQANLIHMVQPVYPAEAKAAHISGTVMIHLVVGKDGTVQTLDVISGPEELRQAAVDAVKQWKYRPTLLNSQPVEVDTKVQVIFDLSGAPETESQTGPPNGAIDPQFKADILQLLDAMELQNKDCRNQQIRFCICSAGHLLFTSRNPQSRANCRLVREKACGAVLHTGVHG